MREAKKFYEEKYAVGNTITTKSGNKFIIKDRKKVKKDGRARLLIIWDGYEHLGESWVFQADIVSGNTQGPYCRQIPGKEYKFPCGCRGRLPNKGKNNKLVVWDTFYGRWRCRVASILFAGKYDAKRNNHKYKPIGINIPHSVIRKLMEEKNCWLCRQKLDWIFKLGKTPHLHHEHENGKIFGFTHPRCNLGILGHEMMELKKENNKLKKRLSESKKENSELKKRLANVSV